MSAGLKRDYVARAPRLLDLFAGAGGAAMGYHRAGFEVVGIDIEFQQNYPFDFHKGDAVAVLEGLIYGSWMLACPRFYALSSFDAIHASPPCQQYSRALKHLSGPKAMLIEPIRELLIASGLPWVLENVPGSPIPTQDTLDGRYGLEMCGTQFGSRVWRHRLFETSFPVTPPGIFCHHDLPSLNPYNQQGRDRIYGEFGRRNPEKVFNEQMGVPWMTGPEGQEAINPDYTEHIGRQMLEHVEAQQAAA